MVESGDDRTELDLGADARLCRAEPGRPAPTLSEEELAVDKVLAVFGRAEARDFVDLAAIEKRYGLYRPFELATEKERGFTPEVFTEMAGRFSRLRADDFDIDANFCTRGGVRSANEGQQPGRLPLHVATTKDRLTQQARLAMASPKPWAQQRLRNSM